MQIDITQALGAGACLVLVLMLAYYYFLYIPKVALAPNTQPHYGTNAPAASAAHLLDLQAMKSITASAAFDEPVVPQHVLDSLSART